jgi:hypothetical protein
MQPTLTADSLADLNEERFVRPQTTVATTGVDVHRLLAAALNQPLNYPPLNEAVFAGDTIAIALQHDLVRPTEILNGLLDYLLTLNVEPNDITVVLPGVLTEAFGISAEECQSKALEGDDQPVQPPPVFQLQKEFHLINCQVHDPENPAGLSYLCANEAGEPVHVNRVLVDADVVIPVGGPGVDLDPSFQNCVYPTFGSSAAIARFSDRGDGNSIADRHAETELANDSLGAFFVVQATAGPGEYLNSFIAGTRHSATAAAAKEASELWTVDCEQNFEAAVLSIESRPDNQSWQNFVAALEIGRRMVVDGAPIVVWSEISSTPAKEIRNACAARFEETIPDSLSKPMQHLAAILKDHPVYLRSRIARGKVEELGLSVIESTEEVKRLTADSNHCVVLRDAHGCRLLNDQLAEGGSDVE